MFDPNSAPSPKGWSKRRNNAAARLEAGKKLWALRAERDAHYAAQRAGFASVAEMEAFKASEHANDAPHVPGVNEDAPADEASQQAPEGQDEASKTETKPKGKKG